MSFADTFGSGAPTETPYQQLGGAPPVQMHTVKKELRANLRVITDMTAGALHVCRTVTQPLDASHPQAFSPRASVVRLLYRSPSTHCPCLSTLLLPSRDLAPSQGAELWTWCAWRVGC